MTSPRTAMALGITCLLLLSPTPTVAKDDGLAVLDGLREPDRRVALVFEATEVDKVLDALSRATGLEIEYAASVPTRRLDIDLPETTLRHALTVIAREAGVSYEMLDPDTLRVVHRGPYLAGEAGVTEPRLIRESKVRPVYPEAERIAGIEGKVILQAVIREDGTLGEVQVLRSQPDSPGFVEAAVDAVKQWRYEPATRHGEPVAVYFTLVIQFSLQKDSA